MLYLTSSVHNPHLTVIFYYSNQGYLGKKKKNYKKIEQQKMEESFGLQYQDLILVSVMNMYLPIPKPDFGCTLNSHKVINVGSDTFGNPIFQKGLQN